MTLHLPLPANPQLPLCGRVLSRNASLTIRDHHSMLTNTSAAISAMASGFAPAMFKPQRVCRHCQRAVGLLPPLGRKAYDPDAATLAMSDDELLEALSEGDEE